jgi:hypothetical protein
MVFIHVLDILHSGSCYCASVATTVRHTAEVCNASNVTAVYRYNYKVKVLFEQRATV